MLNKKNDRLPLTSAQIGVWFEQQLAPENPIYKAVEYIDIHGSIDVTLLEVALRQALSEIAAARVRIEVADEGVWQLIERSVDWRLPVLDLRNTANPWTQAQEWMRADLSRVIDLQHGPVFSVTVLQLATDHFLVSHSAHHLSIDGFGFSLLVQRVADVYTAVEAGLPCPPSTLGSLASLLADETSYQASERYIRDRTYWAEQLANRPAAVGLNRTFVILGVGKPG